jgi:two-component system response regulator YesN
MYRVLLVEDEDIIRRGISSSVPWEEHGCVVAGEARNGQEGAARIAELEPDIVITDINMPVESGLEMLARTKCQYNYVAIILTGYSEFEYAKEAIRNGVSDYVLKPLNTGEMEDALDRAVLECHNIQIIRSKTADLREWKNLSLLPESGAEQAADPVVEKLLAYIAQHYQHKITLTDLAEQLHYTDRYLNQKFQKVLGTTIIEYLNRYRIQKAIQLLQNGTCPLSEAGWECGIGDYKYFSHVFHKYIGCSPKEYLLHLEA